MLVKFYRSYLDGLGVNSISGYAIEMSTTPVAGNYDRIQLGTVLPQMNLSYTYLAHTLYDSSLTNNNTFYFRVTAVTNQNELLRSNIAYGYSIDNLSPAPPLNFYAALQRSNFKLGWKANTEPDFRDYKIYRSDTPVESFNFNPGLIESDSPDAMTLIGTTTDTTFIDTSAIIGKTYYYKQAYDVHDYGSPYSSDSVMAYLAANIRVFLEGAYIGGQMSTFTNALG